MSGCFRSMYVKNHAKRKIRKLQRSKNRQTPMIFDQKISCKQLLLLTRTLCLSLSKKRIKPNKCLSTEFFLLFVFRVQNENWPIIGKYSYLFRNWEKTNQKNIKYQIKYHIKYLNSERHKFNFQRQGPSQNPQKTSKMENFGTIVNSYCYKALRHRCLWEKLMIST